MKARSVQLVVASALAGGLVAIAGSASAHHSYAMFDRTKTATMSGTVRTLQWTNPHVYVWVFAADKSGNPTPDVWGFEFGGGPNGLQRSGWSKRTLNVGDKVTITYNPLRDGRNGGEFQSVVLANGEKWDSRGRIPEGGRKAPPGDAAPN